MLARCGAELMNAVWMLLRLGPKPTFSPMRVQSGATNVLIAVTRFGLCESVPESAIDCDQPRAIEDAAASYSRGGSPFACLYVFVASKNPASSLETAPAGWAVPITVTPTAPTTRIRVAAMSFDEVRRGG